MTKIFPVYFSMQTALPVVMALTYPGTTRATSYAGSIGGVSGLLNPENRWGVLVPIAGIFLSGLANLAVVGPATTKCMERRKAQGELIISQQQNASKREL